jgi:hypothetical protein
MKSIQIGRAALAPCSSPAERLPLVVEPDPDTNRDVGVEADEPCVGVVVDGAGLASQRPVGCHLRGPRARCLSGLSTPRRMFVIT